MAGLQEFQHLRKDSSYLHQDLMCTSVLFPLGACSSPILMEPGPRPWRTARPLTPSGFPSPPGVTPASQPRPSLHAGALEGRGGGREKG